MKTFKYLDKTFYLTTHQTQQFEYLNCIVRFRERSGGECLWPRNEVRSELNNEVFHPKQLDVYVIDVDLTLILFCDGLHTIDEIKEFWKSIDYRRSANFR